MHRVVAALVTVLLLASAGSHVLAFCAGWSSSVEARHECCKAEMVSGEAATDCCAMSEQSSERGPVEARATAPALAVVHLDPARGVDLAPPAVLTVPERQFLRRGSSVPLFLTQHSLLI